jgi:hypothetical protein
MTEVTTENKPWWQSRTIIGALTVVLASVLGGGNAVLQQELTDLVLNAVALLGAVMSIYGRFFATSKLTK